MASSGSPAPTRTTTLLESGKYTDLTVKVNERKWKVHKAVLCTQSDFFAKLCDSGFKESQSNECDLSEDNEHAVAAMIYYLYHKEYDSAAILPSEGEEGKATLHVRVFALAQKYLIMPLETLALDKAATALQDWENIDFAYAAYEIFKGTQDTETGRVLRKKVCVIITTNAAALFSDNERYKDIQEILAQIPKAVNAMITALARGNNKLHVENLQLTTANNQQSTNIAHLQTTITQLMAENARLTASNTALANQPAPTTGMPVPVTPQAAGNFGGYSRWYKCPNCDTVFSRWIGDPCRYTHSCYSGGFNGRLGRSDMTMTGSEWSQHLWN